MQVAVFGAGAVGSMIGARLQERGIDLTLVGRPRHVEAIQANGLKIYSRSGVKAIAIRATTSLDGPADLVLLTVKSQDVRDACREIARAAPGATVVNMQNGVRADGEAAEVLARELVVGCVLYVAVSYLESGAIDVVSAGRLQVGAPFPESAERAAAAVEVLGKAMRTEWVTDLAGARWTKLMGNLSNAIPAATGLSVAEMFAHRRLGRLAVAAMREGVRTAQAARKPLDGSRLARQFRLMAALPEALSLALFTRRLRSQFREGPVWRVDPAKRAPRVEQRARLPEWRDRPGRAEHQTPNANQLRAAGAGPVGFSDPPVHEARGPPGRPTVLASRGRGVLRARRSVRSQIPAAGCESELGRPWERSGVPRRTPPARSAPPDPIHMNRYRESGR